MDKIFIFSGTTEGRELSEYLCQKQIYHEVFVATEYGRVVMKENNFAVVHQGRLDEKEMETLFNRERPDLIVDATHPYAVEVSKNIKKALGDIGRYIRISRNLSDQEELLCKAAKRIKIKRVDSAESATEYLKKSKGRILLTTGVKTLSIYAENGGMRDRLVARILPSEESLKRAKEAGLLPGQIIAMEGPFGKDLNKAIIDQYQISLLVTKISGAKGGFQEKVEACMESGTELVLIEPENSIDQQEISLEEAKTIFNDSKVLLSVVGLGVGDEKSITLEAYKRIKEAQLLIGAERMLLIGSRINPDALLVKEYEKDKVLNSVRENACTRNVYLVSGDTGFFSGASYFKRETNVNQQTEFMESEFAGKNKEMLCQLDNNLEIEILPGISSISYLCAAVGVPYSEAVLLSSHGRELDLKPFIERRENFFMLTSGKDDVNYFVSLLQSNIEATAEETTVQVPVICLGYNMGMEDQQFIRCRLNECELVNKEGLYVLGVIYDV